MALMTGNASRDVEGDAAKIGMKRRTAMAQGLGQYSRQQSAGSREAVSSD
jgi:hypothetical protein